jgi:shikimate 5-dehydrogenase
MRGHSEGKSPVPPEVLRGRDVAYDLVYNPIRTRFLKDAREKRCKTIGGLEMLVAQAALQFELWTGRKAPVALMREAALSKLREK